METNAGYDEQEGTQVEEETREDLDRYYNIKHPGEIFTAIALMGIYPDMTIEDAEAAAQAPMF